MPTGRRLDGGQRLRLRPESVKQAARSRRVASGMGCVLCGQGAGWSCGVAAVRCDHVRVRDGTLSWAEVAARLAPPRNYWLRTAMPSGAARGPGLGVVTGGTSCLYSERRTVKARNLTTGPRVVVHLESGDDVLIVRGTAEDLGPSARVRAVVAGRRRNTPARAAGGILPDVGPAFDVVYALRPRSALTWRLAGCENSQRRCLDASGVAAVLEGRASGQAPWESERIIPDLRALIGLSAGRGGVSPQPWNDGGLTWKDSHGR
jgi:hypothetical protein